MTKDDLEQTWQLQRRAGLIDHPHWVTSLREFTEEFGSEGLVPERDTAVALAEGRIVAFGFSREIAGGDTVMRTSIDGAVDPDWRRRGIGTALLAWQEANARWLLGRHDEVLPGWIETGAAERQSPMIDLFGKHGFRVARWWLEFECDLAAEVPLVEPRPAPAPESAAREGAAPESALTEGAVPEGAVPEGALTEGAVLEGAVSEGAVSEGAVSEGAVSDGAVCGSTGPAVVGELRIVEYGPRWSELARQARNVVFEDHWGSQPTTAADWEAHRRIGHNRDDLSLVAVAPDAHGNDEVVAFALSDINEEEWAARGHSFGYIGYVGVRRAYRGRRLAQALISRVLRSYRAEGLATAVLDVDADSPTGAVGLYENLGFRPVDRSCSLLIEI